jgi:hypothetical protein
MFDDTAIVGFPGAGINRANCRGGPAYWTRTTAVTVESGLFTNRISSAGTEDADADADANAKANQRTAATETATRPRTKGDKLVSARGR